MLSGRVCWMGVSMCVYVRVCHLIEVMRMQRLVFRGHLLPPFITPFKALRKFMQEVHPSEMDTIKSLKDSQMQTLMGTHYNEYKMFRNTLYQQLFVYKQDHIIPLLNCPTFYGQLHEQVRKNMRLMPGVSYEEAQRNIKKKAVLNSFIAKYKKFKKQNHIPSAAILIPPCVYLSPQEMALNEDRQWGALTPDEQTSYAISFNNYLDKHYKTLTGIAGQAGLPLEELLRLMKHEFQPDLQIKIKEILLS